MKKGNGITLIALVITIIVLLILAGVSIAMLSGENSIIGKAVNAKNATRGGAVKDLVTLNASSNVGADYSDVPKKSRAELINELYENGNLTEEEVAELEENDVITIGGVVVDFGILEKTGKTLVQAFKDGEIHVGDYITDYNSSLYNHNAIATLTTEETGFDGGVQSYSVDQNTTWRIMGLNEDKTQLVITTGSPLKKEMDLSATEDWKKDPYLYLACVEGWYNTNDSLVSNNILDKVCAIYHGKYASSTKSMRTEDINVALGLTVDINENKLYKTDENGDKTEIPLYGCGNATYTYKSGDFAPENYLIEKYPGKYSMLIKKKLGDTVTGTNFSYSYKNSPNVVDETSKIYDVLFNDTAGNTNNKSYWIASTYSRVIVQDSYSTLTFETGCVNKGTIGSQLMLYTSWKGQYADMLNAVRPVVYLKPDTTINDLTITSNGSEEAWTSSLPKGYLINKTQEYGKITE